MSFDSIVIVREVWDTRDLSVRVVDERGALDTRLLATRVEPEDLNALEMALQIKDKHGGKVTVLSIGEPSGVDVLKEGLYRGADAAVRLTTPDPLDTQAEAVLVAHAIRKLGVFDLVLAGASLSDGRGSMLGAHVAALLGIEPIGWMDALEEIAPGRVVGRRAIEMGYEYVEARLPAALLVGVALLKEDPRAPRSAKATLKLKHKKTEVPTWTAASLGLEGLGARCTTLPAGHQAIAERAIESRSIDGNDDAALRSMLDAIAGRN